MAMPHLQSRSVHAMVSGGILAMRGNHRSGAIACAIGKAHRSVLNALGLPPPKHPCGPNEPVRFSRLKETMIQGELFRHPRNAITASAE